MRWACVLLPQLALDDALRHCEEPDAPFALLSGPPQRRLLRAVNPAARALGLRPGQPLSAAQALSRHIATADYDSSAIERRQHFLAAWAYRFSSQVSLHYPRALLLEIESSLGLFGPWPRLEARLREELKNLGFQHRITVAPNPAAARMLANTHDGLAVPNDEGLPQTLGQLPIERSGLSREVASTLSRMGLRTLHQVLALPRASIARRFPADVLRHLDTLLGIRPLVVDCYTPPDEFDLRIELNFEVESHQALLFPLRRMLQDLATYLTGRDSGVQRFTLHLVHRALADSRVPVELLSVTREAALLFELTHERLQRLQLPAPVQALRLIARDLPAFVPERRVLFDERPQQSLAWEQLHERLRARLGDAAVHGLSVQADHRPEHAWQPNSAIKPPLPALEVPRPGWLLRTAHPLRGAEPLLLAGPERIESGWWDGGDLRRDYYIIETRSGQRAWAYRPVGEQGPLLLHGWFA